MGKRHRADVKTTRSKRRVPYISRSLRFWWRGKSEWESGTGPMLKPRGRNAASHISPGRSDSRGEGKSWEIITGNRDRAAVKTTRSKCCVSYISRSLRFWWRGKSVWEGGTGPMLKPRGRNAASLTSPARRLPCLSFPKRRQFCGLNTICNRILLTWSSSGKRSCLE